MKDNKKSYLVKFIVLILLIGTLCNIDIIPIRAEGEGTDTVTPAAKPSVVLDIDYITGILTVKAGPGGSNKLYFSTDKQKTWELIETAGGKIDIRALMKTSAVSLFFKGNKDENPVEFIIPAEDKDLKVTYTVVEGVGVINYANAKGKIEYRVGADGSWADVPDSGITTQYYEITGATLQFRIKAQKGVRAGKIVTLKLPKRAKAPMVKVDGSKFVITGLKSGSIEYRVVGTGATDVWKKFEPSDSKVKDIDLASLANPSITPVPNAKIPAVTVEFRSLPTPKSPASAIKTIELDAQRSAPTIATVKLDGTTLTISDASSVNPYEILILNYNEEPNIKTDKWKAVTNSKAQIIKKAGRSGRADIIPGDKIYIRYKAGKDKLTGTESMASLYMMITVTTITNTAKTTPSSPSPSPTP